MARFEKERSFLFLFLFSILLLVPKTKTESEYPNASTESKKVETVETAETVEIAETTETTDVEETAQLEGRSVVRTFFVFTDLPVHYEYRVHDMPLIPEGLEIEFDTVLENPKDPTLKRRVSGPYRVRRKVRYSTSQPSKLGLTQYLELSPVGTDGRLDPVSEDKGTSKTVEGEVR